MKFYHGTSGANISDIFNVGLNCPFLTDRYEVAEYYAQETATLDGSHPIILEVEVKNLSNLQYDSRAMDEPVLTNKSNVLDTYNKMSKEHPEWIKDGYLQVPFSAWQYSLIGAHSVKDNDHLFEFKVI